MSSLRNRNCTSSPTRPHPTSVQSWPSPTPLQTHSHGKIHRIRCRSSPRGCTSFYRPPRPAWSARCRRALVAHPPEVRALLLRSDPKDRRLGRGCVGRLFSGRRIRDPLSRRRQMRRQMRLRLYQLERGGRCPYRRSPPGALRCSLDLCICFG